MSVFGIIAIILLPILGGLIAWAGDVIGYRLGKSRRSLFGLRPRSTARVVGIGVGVALPLVGLLTALAGSQTARVAIFELDKLLAEQRRLSQVNTELSNEVERTQSELLRANEELAATQEELTVAREMSQSSRLELNEKMSELLKTRNELNSTRQTLDNARTTMGELGDRISAMRLVSEKLEQTQRELESEVEALQLQYAELEQVYSEAERDLEETRRESRALQGALQAAQVGYQLERALATGPVAIEPGDELVRVILRVNISQDELEDQIFQVLELASGAALRKGARMGDNGRGVRAVLPVPLNWRPGDELHEDDIVRWVASEMRSGQYESYVISITNVRRLFQAQNDQALVEIVRRPNVRVFREGDLITSVRMDETFSRGEIFNNLLALLRLKVANEARERGLLPNPATGLYGSIEGEALFNAVEEVSGRTNVLVRFIAAQDTYTAEALAVKIEVTAENGSR